MFHNIFLNIALFFFYPIFWNVLYVENFIFLDFHVMSSIVHSWEHNSVPIHTHRIVLYVF